MSNIPNSKNDNLKGLVIRYIIGIFIFTVGIGIFSLIMSSIASYRNSINEDLSYETSRIYNGPLEQLAPNLDASITPGNIYKEKNINTQLVKYYVDNTKLVSTKANVLIDAEFVKKGLVLQPTYKTQFNGVYQLRNDLDEKSIISFVFPLPTNNATNEISNAKLIVNGVAIANSKTTLNDGSYGTRGALRWEGEIPAKSTLDIEASYDTVGLSVFSYEGIENSKDSQDFNFSVQINGTRAYNVLEGLSVDEREFGEKYVKLTWTKPDLYSIPLVNVSVGDKLNPSSQVSRVYLTMAPVYIVFITIILYLAYKFGKVIHLFDMFLITVLFVIYFPLVHYLSSFTIDPTIELFQNIKNVGYYSMPLYGAFGIAILIVGGLMYYFLGKISGFKFASKSGIPTILLFIGFFPLVVTVPEYSILLVIFGIIALLSIIVQVRVKMHNQEND